MSWQAVKAVLNNRRTRTGDRLVLIAIAEMFNAVFDGQNTCRPSTAEIARLANLNPQRTARIIDSLVEAGELIRLVRPGSSSFYIVVAGMTPDEVRAYALAAWGMTLEQVDAANKDAAARLSRSAGNGSTLRQNVERLQDDADDADADDDSADPSTNDRRVEDGEPFDKSSADPSTKRIDTLRQNVRDPSTNDRTEPLEPKLEPKEEPLLGAAAPAPDAPKKPAGVKGSRSKKEPAPAAPREPDPFFDRLADLTQAEPGLQGSMIGKTAAQLKKIGADLAALNHFSDYWYAVDWRGTQGQPPELKNVMGEWGRAKRWDGTAPAPSSRNGSAPAGRQIKTEYTPAELSDADRRAEDQLNELARRRAARADKQTAVHGVNHL